MKAALVQGDGKLKVEECLTPEPGPEEVLVKVAYCGICGSDLHMADLGIFPPGSIIGHETSGHVAAVGEGVQGWSEGDAVIVLPMDPCFACEPCRRGDIQVCVEGIVRGYGLGGNPGGFAQYMLVRPSMLYQVPDGMDMKLAALNEPWAVAVRGVNLSNLRVGDHAVVMGMGPIGLLSVYALKIAGAVKIYVSEPDPFRAEKAQAAGVDGVFDPKKVVVADEVRKAGGRAPDVVIDCAGTETSIEEAGAIVGPHGRIVVLGVHMGNVALFPMNWFMKEIRLSFSLGYSLREFESSIGQLARGAVDPEVVVSDVVPLDEIERAFESLHGSGHTKVLVDCQGV
jgi:(R,R)-butanediol dehydrogenase/meso-butanediol dehydrogenase/diacetyl reductase